MTFWDLFTHPVLRAPTWGCIFMCLSSSLMGVLVFLRKRSLLAESLSHASYPGAVIGIFLFAFLFPLHEEWAPLAVLAGAFVSSLFGLKAIRWLEEKGRARTDAALGFVLAVFFGIGIVASSALQSEYPVWHAQVQMLLFGQAATMTDIHIVLYGFLALAAASFLFLMFRPLQASLFDRNFSMSSGLQVPILEKVFFWLLLLSLIVGIRSVGVVLMSGMAIAPAVAARQFSDRLQTIFLLSALFGSASGFLGNYLSVSGSNLPTGPMIVLIGTAFAVLSLIFAPKRGLVFRFGRILAFRFRCLKENILKGIWRKGGLSLDDLKGAHHVPSFFLRCVLWRLRREGWVAESKGQFALTRDGVHKAVSIVRLHRLWELYLAESLGLHAEKVHRTAEEMEHILTPEIEERLTRLFSNPEKDPHQQPIPQKPRAL